MEICILEYTSQFPPSPVPNNYQSTLCCYEFSCVCVFFPVSTYK